MSASVPEPAKSGAPAPARRVGARVYARSVSQPSGAVTTPSGDTFPANPWPALWALCLGFFMILVDSTIVSVATPAIIVDLRADVDEAVWVTSAYLLAYAVPVLITGRLGDRYGQRRLYLLGLTVFTLASLWCGLTGSIEGLIVARVVQGLGAAAMTPQTMAVITRIFPPARRGRAMALWGATAGVATLVGPILGGLLVDAAGWEWIFIINVPVGVVGFVLAWRLVPHLETHPHAFDWLGVALSGLGMFLLVFGLQEGGRLDWSVAIWAMIGGGLALLGAFVLWQARNTREPLVPLHLFRDRNFSLANLAITTMSLVVTAFAIPFMLYAQLVRGYSPTQAALLLAPMALTTLLLAPLVGRLTDSMHPRLLAGFGYGMVAVSMFWLVQEVRPDSAVWELVLPMIAFGVANACVWAPTSATANRNLPLRLAGAGAGVYNATRQVGAVVGSAAIAALMHARLVAEGLGTGGFDGAGVLPEALHEPFSDAMAQSLLLTPLAILVGFVAVLFFERPQHQREPAPRAVEADPVSP